MGLFKKAEKKEEAKKEIAPSIPELPKLPELPSYPGRGLNSPELPQLPSLQNNPFESNFSNYNIKEAVTGEKEEQEGNANEFVPVKKVQMMQKPLIEKPIEEEIKSYDYNEETKSKQEEPLFVRIDKFEEGSEIFKQVKKQVSEIEKLFADLEKIKEDEDGELKSFEEEIKEIKTKIESIDKTIFSKLG